MAKLTGAAVKIARRSGPLLASGIIAAPLFTALFCAAAARRPDYASVRFPISSLAIGPGGWLQTVNFILTGALFIACAAGLHAAAPGRRSAWLPWLVTLSGIGLIGAGVFTSDPVFGYPPHLPLRLAQFTPTGHLHDLASLLFFAGLPAAEMVEARSAWRDGDWVWAGYSALTLAASLILFVLTSLGFRQLWPLVTTAGILQRGTVLTGMIWLTLLALRTMRGNRRRQRR